MQVCVDIWYFPLALSALFIYLRQDLSLNLHGWTWPASELQGSTVLHPRAGITDVCHETCLFDMASGDGPQVLLLGQPALYSPQPDR